MLRTLLLFDIDGTLIGESQAGQAAYVKAIKSCFNLEIDLQGYSTAGKTDILILYELLEINGVDERKIDKDKLVDSYLIHLEETVLHDPGIILPGVKKILHELIRVDDIFLALGTGNLEKAARIKLGVHSLDRYFQTGGFGSDATERADLIAKGIKKAVEHFGVKYQRIIVVGDTPFDVEAAKYNEIHSIAVATGPHGLETLRNAGATQVLPELAESEAFLEILSSLPPNRT